MTRDKHNYWLMEEARHLFDHWKFNKLRYKSMDFEDAPIEIRNHFKRIVLSREEVQKRNEDPISFRKSKDKAIAKDNKKDDRIRLK